MFKYMFKCLFIFQINLCFTILLSFWNMSPYELKFDRKLKYYNIINNNKKNYLYKLLKQRSKNVMTKME